MGYFYFYLSTFLYKYLYLRKFFALFPPLANTLKKLNVTPAKHEQVDDIVTK